MAVLKCILARKADVGVILRRGPSKQVAVIKWDLKKDQFEEGQWLKGRIYEDDCDLSPNGLKFAYCATDQRKFGRDIYAYMAISQCPYLTALEFFDYDSTRFFGLIFQTDEKILGWPHIHEFRHNKNIQHGEYDLKDKLWDGVDFEGSTSKYSTRQQLSGWRRIKNDGHEIIFAKSVKRLHQFKIQQHNKKYYSSSDASFNVVDHQSNEIISLTHASWVDWDKRNGDLLYAASGKLFRVKHGGDPHGFSAQRTIELADFNQMTFKAVKAPKEALVW